MDTVNRNAPLFLRGMIVCTDPLPKVVSPNSTALLWSWRAPATISEAGVLPDIKVEEEGEEFLINTETDNQLNYAIKLFVG